MKVCTYIKSNDFYAEKRLGIFDGTNIVDPQKCWEFFYFKEGRYNPKLRAQNKIPSSLFKLLNTIDAPLTLLKDTIELYAQIKKSGFSNQVSLNDFQLQCPLDQIGCYRDFYTHEKHVKKGFEKRNEEMPKAWYEMPVYYKGATAGFIGPEVEIPWPSFTDKLDYELELAAIIGKDGKSISEKNAYQHIFGFTILNDVSARDLQKKEMSVRLGPSKAKDFCSILGPVIITADEFNFSEPKLKMQARINNSLWSEGQSDDSHYSFAEMIEFCSKEEWLLPGDLIGSGTVGTGCGLELDKWIQPGDQIELEIERIGILKNKVGSKRNS
jgi:2-keto-4-pentenoate hydratase/2-oxohepta-3-ene-1,7-dioic acid hydratase in catechol pathway